MKTLINTLILLLVMVVAYFVFFYNATPTGSVVAPEVMPQRSEYRYPVREGNCWRQFIGTGTSNSILVCG
jgi:hypothetical protein